MTGDKITYTHEAVLKSCLEYYDGDIMQSSITQKKYLLRDKDGTFYESNPDHMHDRLAREFARIEKKMNQTIDENAYFARVRALLNRFSKTVPQGSPMAAIGNDFQIQSLSNCMVIAAPHDSMAGIFKSGLEIAELQKRRAGVGIDLSTLRPVGSKVNNAALSSSGVPCFSDFYSDITRMIGQRGRVGALMLTLDIRHPDVEYFTCMKSDLTKVTGANVSLKLTDEFMSAVENDKEFVQQWPIDVPLEQAKVVKKTKARDLWNIIIEQAWKTAEPGLLMWDNYTRMLPAHQYPGFETQSTNPCSEIALSPNDSCRLISQNLFGWVKDPFLKDARFDFDEYFEDTRIAQRMSDGIVELELESIQKIIDVSDSDFERELWNKVLLAACNGRRTGLGTHGLADVFLALGIRYDSDDAIDLVDKIYNTHKLASYTESIQMAKERGAFPAWNWKYDERSEFIRALPEKMKLDIKKYGRRNISNLTIAPTGSVSVVSGTSSGIEPVFRLVYDRRVKITHVDMSIPVDYVDAVGDKWTNFRVVHPMVKHYFKAKGIKCPINSGRDFSMTLEDANEIIEKQLPKWFVTSNKINYMQGIKLQAMATKHLDHGVSKTINLPKGSKKDEVSQVYFKAWKMGLKGVTVYVDGSRDGVLISETKKEPSDENRPSSIIDNHAPKRPKSLSAEIHHIKIKGKDWAVVVGLLGNKPYETFAGRGLVLPKTDKIESATITKVSNGRYKLSIKIVDNGIEEYNDLREIYDNNEERVITRSVCRELRHGIPIEFIAKDLAEHSGSIANFSAALARVLKKYAKNANRLMKKCPQCSGTDFIMQDGCASCVTCYFSKCS
jgi:ribonucleoside-diphosphate reductase alpha chain